jgi:hypothetical protein
MCAGLEGEGAREEAILIELGAIVVAGWLLLDEVDGGSGDGEGTRVGSEGES